MLVTPGGKVPFLGVDDEFCGAVFVEVEFPGDKGVVPVAEGVAPGAKVVAPGAKVVAPGANGVAPGATVVSSEANGVSPGAAAGGVSPAGGAAVAPPGPRVRGNVNTSLAKNVLTKSIFLNNYIRPPYFKKII